MDREPESMRHLACYYVRPSGDPGNQVNFPAYRLSPGLKRFKCGSKVGNSAFQCGIRPTDVTVRAMT